MKKDAAEPDGGTVHEHEFARHPHRTFFLERLVNFEGLAAPIFARFNPIRDTAHAIINQWPVNESGPDVEGVDEISGKVLEPPCLIGMHDKVVVTAAQSVVEVNDATDERGRKDEEDAQVEKVDGCRASASVST